MNNNRQMNLNFANMAQNKLSTNAICGYLTDSPIYGQVMRGDWPFLPSSFILNLIGDYLQAIGGELWVIRTFIETIWRDSSRATNAVEMVDKFDSQRILWIGIIACFTAIPKKKKGKSAGNPSEFGGIDFPAPQQRETFRAPQETYRQFPPSPQIADMDSLGRGIKKMWNDDS
jgi:hypothetical protein